MSKGKWGKRSALGRSGRMPWTRRELGDWLTNLQRAHRESPEGEWKGALLWSVFFLNQKYGGKMPLWIGRVKAIIEFMHSFQMRLIEDGYIAGNDGIEVWSDELLDALAKLPSTNHRTGFSYARVENYISSVHKPS